MKDGVPLVSSRLGTLHAATDSHDLVAVRGRFNAYSREEKLEPYGVVVSTVYDLLLS